MKAPDNDQSIIASIVLNILFYHYKNSHMENEKKQTSHDQGRREFMKQSTLLAGGLLAMPVLTHANYFSGARETIKIALIGCGGRGTGAATQALSTKENVGR